MSLLIYSVFRRKCVCNHLNLLRVRFHKSGKSTDTLIMPRKIRQLIKELEKAGFVNRGGKGNHRNLIHPNGIAMTISGNLGDDAKHYQEKEVELKIERSKR